MRNGKEASLWTMPEAGMATELEAYLSKSVTVGLNLRWLHEFKQLLLGGDGEAGSAAV